MSTCTKRYKISEVTIAKVQEFIDSNLFTYDEDGESYNNDVALQLKRELDSEVIDDNLIEDSK